jgi:hypothetical protein
MPSNAEVYAYAILWLVSAFRSIVEYLIIQLGSEVLAYIAIGLVAIPISALFFWSQYVLIPKFFWWWYEESITEKAINWWRKYRLNYLGFKHSTAIIAVVTGFLFYVLIRAVAAFPAYFHYTIPGAVVVFCLVAVLGYFVSGNVPENDRARQQYCKRFQSPTVTGLGLAVGGLAIDFLIYLCALVVNNIISLV